MRSFRLNRWLSHPPSRTGPKSGRRAVCADARCVFIRRMASAFKQFQAIFAVRKAQSLGLFGPSATRFGVRRREGGVLTLSPAPLLEEQAFQNVRSVIVTQPL